MTSNAPSTPRADIDITPELVSRLLEDQFPDLSRETVKIMEAGWDNVMVRVGTDLALRLPRRAIAADLIRNEQKWLRWLAPQLPLPIPVPLNVGQPTAFYPYPWSVQKWLPGQAADIAPPDPGEAGTFAKFFKTLHSLPVPANAPRNIVRDCGLGAKKVDTEKRLEILAKDTPFITNHICAIWNDGLETEIDTEPCFIAGDVHARNILVNKGRLSAIIDWGDMCAGDPATDLAAIWGVFDDANARTLAIQAYGMSEALLRRSQGWAVFYAAILLETGRKDTPRHAKMGADIFRHLDADAQIKTPAQGRG